MSFALLTWVPFAAGPGRDAWWIGILVTLEIAAAGRHLALAKRWPGGEQSVGDVPAFRALRGVPKAFVFCGACGYLFVPLQMFWPWSRAFDVGLAILSYFAWRHALHGASLGAIRIARSGSERLARDLAALRAERSELEFQVRNRTAETNEVIAALEEEIRERRRAADTLAQERNLLHTLIDALPDLVYVKDTQGRYVLNNRAHLRFLGATSPEQIAGKTVFDFFPRGLATRYHADDLRATRSGEELVTAVEPTIDHSGKAMWVARTKVPLRDGRGEVIGLVGIARDVTESRDAEVAMRAMNETLERRVAERTAAAEQRALALLHSQQALQKQTYILQSILDSMGDGVLVADEHGALLHCNPAAEKMLGVALLAGSPRDWSTRFELLLPNALTPFPACDRPFDRALRGELVDEAEAFVRQPDGRQGLWVSTTARPLKDEDGAIRGGVVVFHDVTYRKLVETELNQAKEVAEAANDAKSEFLANMSHEIRTPMTAIIGYADRMLELDHNPADRHECLQVIRRNSLHLLGLINDILDISKIEAGQMTVETISCGLPQLLADVLSMKRPNVVKKGLEFALTFDGPIPRQIQTDPMRVKQILVNLLGNAIKFTPRGRVSLRTSCDASGPSIRLKFEVMDTGVGMSEEQLARLFTPFMQADESTTRRFGGTGLGLTISRRFARLLGGDVAAQSQPGVGSVFTATIDGGPSAGVEMVDGLNEATLPAPVSYAAARHLQIKGRILLAEDGLDNQRLLLAYLCDAGADVTVAENGRIAVELASRQPFDLILMDMQMPELDGYGATAELRRLGLTLPILALTAHAMADDRAKCLASGCTDYLTKPIDREHLFHTISHHLGQTAVSIPAAAAAAGQHCTSAACQEVSDQHEELRSSFAGVAKMKKILDEFVAGMAVQVGQISGWLEDQDLQSLRRAAHQLKGAGGGYGFPQITELAGRVEQSISATEPLDVIAREADELVRLIRRVEGYDPRLEKPTGDGAAETVKRFSGINVESGLTHDAGPCDD